MSDHQVTNRRHDRERRKEFVTPRFPFYDYAACLVTHDRRCLPDRRLEGITVEWITDQEILANYPGPDDDEDNSHPAI
jgi:hypothetical protein